MTPLTLFLRFLLAVFLGGIIGFEREAHGRVAGIRDHVLVCTGSALAAVLSLFLVTIYPGSDPSRIMSQVVSGIGFLGAGAILRFRASVAGLTTAASLWVVATIGLVVGSGFYLAAILATLLVWVCLFVMRTMAERFLSHREESRTLELEMTKGSVEQLQRIRDVLAEYHSEIRDLEFSRLETDKVRVQFHLKLLSTRDEDSIVKELVGREGISRALWKS